MKLTVLFGLFSTLADAQLTLTRGEIRGAVVSPAGAAVAGAVVTLNPAARTSTHFSANTTTGADGAFTFTSVPLGTYAVCPQSLTLGDFCAWNAPVIAEITLGARVKLPKFTFQPTSTIRIRVDDPSGYLQAEGTKPAARLFLVVLPPSRVPIMLFPSKSDAGGRDYQALLPEGAAAQFTISSRYYKIVDNSGAAIDRDRGMSVDYQTAGAAAAAQRFQIVGIYP